MIVGVAGRIGAGKDTVFQRAQLLASKFSLPAPERMAFADKLKDSVAALFDLNRADIDRLKMDRHARVVIEDKGRGLSMSFRDLLQRYGTEAHRHVFGPDFWVNALLPEGFDHSNRLIFITDMRFPNEAARVRSLGGVTVRAFGPESMDASIHLHASETALDGWRFDAHINNTVRGDNFKHLDSEVSDLLLAIKTEQKFTSALDADLSEFGTPNIVDLA